MEGYDVYARLDRGPMSPEEYQRVRNAYVAPGMTVEKFVQLDRLLDHTINRAPDGTLTRLTPEQRERARALEEELAALRGHNP